MRQQYSLETTVPKPFVKWAGGKRQLIPTLSKHFPKSYGTYFEPFLGGGAVLFHLLLDNPNQKCSVSDLNSDLVLAYVTIRDRVNELITSLKKHSKNYFTDKNSYYYKIRENEPKGQIEKTSRLIFLNRTCFNGLYRVNGKGKFNVPLGRYSNPNIVNEENLRAISRVLQSRKISIKCKDFSGILEDVKKDDFIYFDPPYQPVSKTANFTSYTNRDFSLQDLQRLAELCHSLDSKGCNVVLSNSNTDEVKSMFDRSWKVKEIQANRAINSDSKKRTGHSELVIKNF
ncbi:MAG: DNA adenine methylase [Nitrosopumilaceae archaeon]